MADPRRTAPEAEGADVKGNGCRRMANVSDLRQRMPEVGIAAVLNGTAVPGDSAELVNKRDEDDGRRQQTEVARMIIRHVPTVVPAEGVILERVLDATYPLWNGGLSRQAYGTLDAAQMKTAWDVRARSCNT